MRTKGFDLFKVFLLIFLFLFLFVFYQYSRNSRYVVSAGDHLIIDTRTGAVWTTFRNRVNGDTSPKLLIGPVDRK